MIGCGLSVGWSEGGGGDVGVILGKVVRGRCVGGFLGASRLGDVSSSGGRAIS